MTIEESRVRCPECDFPMDTASNEVMNKKFSTPRLTCCVFCATVYLDGKKVDLKMSQQADFPGTAQDALVALVLSAASNDVHSKAEKMGVNLKDMYREMRTVARKVDMPGMVH